MFDYQIKTKLKNIRMSKNRTSNSPIWLTLKCFVGLLKMLWFNTEKAEPVAYFFLKSPRLMAWISSYQAVIGMVGYR